MIISDKQELRRCVKQAVRRAQIAECCLRFDPQQGALGVDALLDESGMRGRKGTPFGTDGAAFYAAMEALELPTRDLNSARTMQESYDRHAYIREILDAMKARRVLTAVDVRRSDADFYGDERLAPLVCVKKEFFAPGRYGIPFEQLAKELGESIRVLGARDVLLDTFDAEALRYCVLPVCEDMRCVVHVYLTSEEEIGRFSDLLDASSVRALVSAPECIEAALLHAAAERPRMLVCLSGLKHLDMALSLLGARFVPYSSRASAPEMMLGRWLCAKEALWQALCDAYLPLARAGYALESASVEQDVQMLLSGNIMNLYETY
ncbi:MAG: hypothetical protein J6K32_09365 [Clostridia bacterium]|nr:hypothetical protein [Clostridia bacterium]